MLENNKKIKFNKPLAKRVQRAARKSPPPFVFQDASIAITDDNFVLVKDLREILEITTHQDWVKQKDGEYIAHDVNFFEEHVKEVKRGNLKFYVHKKYHKYDDIINAEHKAKLIKLITSNDGLKYRFAADNGISTAGDEDIVADMIEFASFTSLYDWITGKSVRKMLKQKELDVMKEIRAAVSDVPEDAQ